MMSDTKAVLRKLLSDHRGEHNAVTQKQLSDATGVNPSTLRSELRRLREERNIPIANQRQGYYVIQDREELQDFVGHINEEIQSKRDTIEHTLEAFQSFDADDVDVSPESETVTDTYECAKCNGDVPKDTAKWPKQGQYEDDVVCKTCFGNLVVKGEA